MRRRPPHIVVTTPESLYVMLGSESGRRMLATTRTVIVDEIHALASGQARRPPRAVARAARRARGPAAPAHRAVGDAEADRGRGAVPRRRAWRLRHRRHGARARARPRDRGAGVAARGGDVQRGMGAGVRRAWPSSRPCTGRRWSSSTRVAWSNASRATCPRSLGRDQVMAHHGSMAREIRLAAEQRLKHGDLRVLVATASLELGIDIGDVDLVCQIASPRSIATLLQRVGRAGHAVGGVPKARIFPTSRDELVECAALLDAVQRRRARSADHSREAARRPGTADRRRGRCARVARGRALRLRHAARPRTRA